MEQSLNTTQTKTQDSYQDEAEKKGSSLLGQSHTVLTPSEVATLLRVTSEQVRNLIRQHRLPAINVGAGKKRPLYRIRQQALDDFLDNSHQKSQSGPKKKFRRHPPAQDFFPELR